jgi:hypothetical protein
VVQVAVVAHLQLTVQTELQTQVTVVKVESRIPAILQRAATAAPVS